MCRGWLFIELILFVEFVESDVFGNEYCVVCLYCIKWKEGFEFLLIYL